MTARGGRERKEMTVNSSTQRHRRYVRRITLTLLAALTLAPAVQARPDPTTGASVAAEPVVVETRDAFDWADAGIGAGAAGGIVVLAGAAAGAILHRRPTSLPRRADNVLS
jgi:hypothetical protein